MREKGDRRAAIIRGLRSQTARLLAVLLIGQNLFLTAASATATSLADDWIGPRYGKVAAVLFSILFSTITLFIFAEMMPKAVAAASPVAVARAVAVPLSWMTKLLSPVAVLCVKLTTKVLRVFGVPEHRPGLTEEELKSIFNLGADEGVIHRDERQLLHKVIEFGDKTVRDIMVPRTKIVAVPETASFEDVKMLLREHKFSRLPVYRGTLDNVVGILHAKDLFDLTDEEEKIFELPKYRRPAVPRAGVQAGRGALPRNAPAPHPHGHRRRRARRHGGPRHDRERHRGASRTDPGRVRRGEAELRARGRPGLRSRWLPAAGRPRGPVRHQASARRSRDHRRPPHAPVRPHPPEGRALEGAVRRFRDRGRHSDGHPEDQDDPADLARRAGRAGETGGPLSASNPNPKTVTLIRGDGIGPEVADAVLSILDAAGAPLSWEEVLVGRDAEAAEGDPLPARALESIRRNGVALKGPVGTPIGKGFQSVNVRLRQTLDLYANLRPVKNLPNVASRFSGVDLVVVRENTEDLYAGLEHTVVPGVVESLKIITEAASTRIARFGFEYARAHGRRRVTAVHKANIMKLSDGLFLRSVQRVAEDFPDIVFDERIVDAACMDLVLKPEKYDVLLLPNLYGDIVSDLAAGLVGGLGPRARAPTSARRGRSSKPSTGPPPTSPARTRPTRRPCSCPPS